MPLAPSLAHRLRFAALLCALVAALAGCGRNGAGSGAITVALFQFAPNDELDRTRDGFIQALSEAGYKDGVNVRYDRENANGDAPTGTLIAKKLAGSDARLIFAAGTPALQNAIAQVKDKPIIFGCIANPLLVGAGKSATDHLPNVTGAAAPSPIQEGLALLKSVKASTRRVGVIADISNLNSQWNLDRTREAGTALGLTIEHQPVHGSSEVFQAAQTLAQKGMDAFYIFPDHVVRESSDSIVKVANSEHIPICAGALAMAKEGAAMTLGWDYFDNGYLSGKMAVRVLKGESPAKMPFQDLSKKLVYLNTTAAEKQGLVFSQTLLKKADKVFQ